MWDCRSDALITFNHNNFIGDLAYIVENDVLLYGILNELKSIPNVTLKNNARISSVMLNCDNSTYGEVHLASGEQYSADLIVRTFFLSFCK